MTYYTSSSHSKPKIYVDKATGNGAEAVNFPQNIYLLLKRGQIFVNYPLKLAC